MCFSQSFLSWHDSSRHCHVMFSPTISVLGEAAETIWHWVNMAIVKLMLCFTTIVHGSFMFCFKKSSFTMEFQMPRGQKLSYMLATSYKILVTNTSFLVTLMTSQSQFLTQIMRSDHCCLHTCILRKSNLWQT